MPLQIFTNIIQKDPVWSEVWNKKSTLLYLMNDFQRSLKDIDNTLKLEEYEKVLGNLKKIKIYI